MIIEIGLIPPTINTAYGRNRQGRRYLSDAGKHFKSIVKAKCIRFKNTLEERPYSLKIEIYKPWLTKQGKVAKSDISNRIKLAEDALMEGLGIDDRFIFSITAVKVESENLKTVFSLEPL